MMKPRFFPFTVIMIFLLGLIFLFGQEADAVTSDDGDYEYTILDGTATIIDYLGAGEDVEIPSAFGSLEVTVIGDFAFDTKGLKSVTIPDSVTSIGDNAFRSNLLTSVTIPDNVTRIGNQAFINNALTNVVIPNKVISIGASAFSNNLLTSVMIGNSVEIIEGNAFSNNALTSVTIPDSVTSIEYSAFSNNELTSVTIGRGMTSIGDTAFSDNKLVSFTILNSNTLFSDNPFTNNPINLTLIGPLSSTIRTLAVENNIDFKVVAANLAVPPSGTYSEADSLIFTLSYANDIVVSGTPKLLLKIGNGSSTQEFHADYMEHPGGDLSKLSFEFVVPSDLADTDGIEIGSEMILTGGSVRNDTTDDDSVTHSISLPDTSGIQIYSIAPTITLSVTATDSTVTSGSVEVNVDTFINGEGSGNGLAKLRWLSGSHNVADFTGGTSGNDIKEIETLVVTTNGIYTVYAQDGVGNEAVEEIDITNIIMMVPSLGLTANTSSPTNDEVIIGVTAEVYGEGLGNELIKLSWMSGSHESGDFTGGTDGTDIMDIQTFTATTNGIYTVYAKDEAGNESVKKITIANIFTTAPFLTLSSSPTTSTTGSVSVNVTAVVYGEALGNELVKLSWLSGSQEVADFTDGTGGTDILLAKTFLATANGTYTVYAQDEAGNEVVKEIIIANIVTPSPDDDESEPSTSIEPDLSVIINPDGGITFNVDPSLIVKETLEDGTIIEKVDLTEEILEEVLNQLEETDNPVVIIEVKDTEGVVQVQFPAASLSSVMETHPDAVFEIKLSGSSFQLQVNVLDLEAMAESFGVNIEDLNVNIEIAQVQGDVKEQLERLADSQGLTFIGKAIEYKITVSSGDQSIEVHDFGGTYMIRAIVLEGDTTNTEYTAVYYDQVTQQLSFIPGVLTTRADGSAEMQMHVPHNSIYAIIETKEKTFADLSGHWAKADVDLLASNLIVKGVTSDRFAPSESITRAEFTALLVRSLGLLTESTANSTFTDVDEDAWYADNIEAAVKAELVHGVTVDHFAPNDKITREQMAVMITKAIELTGVPAIEVNEENVLAPFTDRNSISEWAQLAVVQAVESGIINGLTDDTIAPTDHATRAQATVMLKRLLIYIGFIE